MSPVVSLEDDGGGCDLEQRWNQLPLSAPTVNANIDMCGVDGALSPLRKPEDIDSQDTMKFRAAATDLAKQFGYEADTFENFFKQMHDGKIDEVPKKRDLQPEAPERSHDSEIGLVKFEQLGLKIETLRSGEQSRLDETDMVSLAQICGVVREKRAEIDQSAPRNCHTVSNYDLIIEYCKMNREEFTENKATAAIVATMSRRRLKRFVKKCIIHRPELKVNLQWLREK